MNYKKGFKIKPKEVRSGEVIFTDGTNDVKANEVTCKAYGYYYSKADGICKAYKKNFKLNKVFKNISNSVKGTTTQRGSTNILSNGQDNSIKTNAINSFLNGQKHEITDNVSNTSAIGGSYGKVLRRGEVLIGGGGYANKAGETQMSFVQCSAKTTAETATKLRLQYVTDDASRDYINVQKNSLIGLEAHILAICTGGSSGTVGHYKYIKLKAGVLTDNALSGTITQSQATVASSGTTGSATLVTSSDGYIAIQVTGTSGMNVEWSANVHLYELKTNTAEIT